MRIKIKKIYTGYEIFENKVLEIRDGKIFSIDNNFQKFDKNFEENIMIPGFIDNHIHGGYGYNMNGASIKELENFSEELLRDGTTSYLATLGAEIPQNISKNISTFKKYIQEENKNGAEMIGIHLEGPFSIQNLLVCKILPKFICQI
ncbi:MAG: amidohydrolase family protein [Fusobacteriaceae bacterium]